jgi:hypothetical protein
VAGPTYDQWQKNNLSNGSYYDPSSNYGGSYDMTGTPLGSTYLNQNPDAAYAQWGAANGFGLSGSTRDRYYRQQVIPNLSTGFKAANAKNINLTIEKYLNSIDASQLQREFELLSPDQRGEMNARFAPAMRVVNRG